SDTNFTRIDWTTQALLEVLWADEVPDFTFLWMNEPDASQHRTAPGTRQSLAGIRNADRNLERVLRALDSKGLRDKTDIIVVSDHGCSTSFAQVDLAGTLQKAGISAVRKFTNSISSGDVLIVSNSGSAAAYVI